jgi:uncharacterized metal-binding protein YceD (DUF177 family)
LSHHKWQSFEIIPRIALIFLEYFVFLPFVLVTMFDKAEDLIIEFVKLKDGKHSFNFRVDKTFFEELGSAEVHKADVEVEVLVDKNVNWMHCHIDIHGSMTVDCHRCLVDIPLGIETKYLLIVKLDSHETVDVDHEDEGVELIYLRPHDFELSIARPVYETSLLALPMIRNCDDLEIKPCDQAMIQKLNTLSGETTDEVVDARWEKLKQLKNK